MCVCTRVFSLKKKIVSVVGKCYTVNSCKLDNTIQGTVFSINSQHECQPCRDGTFYSSSEQTILVAHSFIMPLVC